MALENKVFQAEVKLFAEAEGSVRAVFSTFDIVDNDGDIVKSSAIADGQEVMMASYGHKWDQLPVGKGVIKNTGAVAIFEGEFFLDTEAGRETYKTVKAMGSQQRWSWGFSILKDGAHIEEIEGVRHRVITDTKIFEVSPVLVPANDETGTVSIKAKGSENVETDNGSANADSDSDNSGEELALVSTDVVTVTNSESEEKAAGSTESMSDAISLIKAEIVGILSQDSTSVSDVSLLMEAAQMLEWYTMSIFVDEMSMASDSSKDDARKQRAHDGLADIIDRSRKEIEQAGFLVFDVHDDESVTSTFVDHGNHVLDYANAFLDRAKSLADLRAKGGRALAQRHQDTLAAILDAMNESTHNLQTLLDAVSPKEVEPDKSADQDDSSKVDANADAERDRRLRLAQHRDFYSQE